MLLKTLLTASLITFNTYYPITLKKNSPSGYSASLKLNKNIVSYDKCLFYNNSCCLPIKTVYPNLHKYDKVYSDDINVSVAYAIQKLKNLNITTNYKVNNVTENSVNIELYSQHFTDIQIILTPVQESFSRIFIFYTLPNYKKTLAFYNLRFIVNNIRY
jgi:hypothetical protein